jgi:hypothetical protein
VMAPGSQLSQGIMSCPVISKSLRTQGLERCMLMLAFTGFVGNFMGKH